MLSTDRNTQATRVVALVLIASLAGCGGGGSSGSSSGAISTTPPAPVTPAPAPVTGFAELTWSAPTLNEDGTPLTNLAGYKVRYGQSVSALAQTLNVASPGTTSVRIDGLTAGTWYFTLASYTNTGVESAQTGAVWKTIQ
jgi:hypothetical protein